MLLKLIKSIVTESEPKVEGKDVQLKNADSKKLLDLANEALRTDAAKLEDLINVGMPVVNRRKFKDKVKKKVSKIIADEFNDPEIVEEVTERIVDAAEFDPYYREMFEKD